MRGNKKKMFNYINEWRRRKHEEQTGIIWRNVETKTVNDVMFLIWKVLRKGIQSVTNLNETNWTKRYTKC